jgi:polyisoprenyl-teichoic acid--peptidoglycan teichoic acid transferase
MDQRIKLRIEYLRANLKYLNDVELAEYNRLTGHHLTHQHQQRQQQTHQQQVLSNPTVLSSRSGLSVAASL